MTSTRARAPWRDLVLIWFGWAVLICGYQAFAPARFEIQRPDHSVYWVADESRADSHKSQPYLLDPFLNAHVAWDSEFYISIALRGYDDPALRALAPGSKLGDYRLGPKAEHPDWVSLNYAFFPGYPLAMRVLAWPLGVFGLDPVATVTLAGVIVSLAGTLGAMIALYDLARIDDEEQDATRAAFYLLAWPASFFLAQVYAEGLFLGLSFGALALMRRRRWGWAALLAAGATWTRATGALLFLPFAWTWLASGGLAQLRRPSLRTLRDLALVGAPAFAYLIWRAALGDGFHFVETNYFGRGLLWLSLSRSSWGDALRAFVGGGPQPFVYYLVEFLGLAAGIVTSLALWRRNRMLALYGLAIIGMAVTSGAAQGMHRYVLSVPALFLVPARWGRNLAFDRLWTLAGVLGMAVFALAFSIDFWAG